MSRKKTIGEILGKMRADAGFSMREVAIRCDLSEAVVWKLENDRLVRWETVHIILTLAFKVKFSSKEYQEIHELWLQIRKKVAEAQPPDFAKKSLPKSVIEGTRKFRILIRDLTPAQTKYVISCVEQAVLRSGGGRGVKPQARH